MYQILDYRLQIEKPDSHEKYYPRVISGDTVDAYPLSSPASANVKIVSNNNLYTTQSISQVEFDDIARLQVSIRYHRNEKHVWQDVFEGRVQNQSKDFSSNNTIDLALVGHMIEAYYSIITADQSWTNLEAKTILSNACSGRLSRLVYNAGLAMSGQTIQEYNVKEKQYISDVFEDLEKMSGYKWMIGVKPTYATNGNYINSQLTWKPFSTTATTQYKVIEGTPRLLSATFDVVGDEVYNYRYVMGGNDANSVQYVGSSSNPSAILKYGARYTSETYGWLKSNSACAAVAAGLVSDSKDVGVAGSVTLLGTPEAKLGDLVYVKIPSLEVNGAAINGYYVVMRVTHNLSENGYTTTLDLGRIKKDAYDYIAKNITQVVKTCKKNFYCK